MPSAVEFSDEFSARIDEVGGHAAHGFADAVACEIIDIGWTMFAIDDGRVYLLMSNFRQI